MKQKYERKHLILAAIADKPHLIWVETSTLRIPEAIAEYDPDVFICFNSASQRYEVHSLANKTHDTFNFSVEYEELDDRLLNHLKRHDLKRIRMKDLIWEMDQRNDQRERQNANHRRSDIEAWAKENRTRFKKFADEVY